MLGTFDLTFVIVNSKFDAASLCVFVINVLIVALFVLNEFNLDLIVLSP